MIQKEKEITIEWNNLSIDNGVTLINSNGRALPGQLTIIYGDYKLSGIKKLIRFLTGNLEFNAAEGTAVLNGCEINLQNFYSCSLFSPIDSSDYLNYTLLDLIILYDEVYYKTKLCSDKFLENLYDKEYSEFFDKYALTPFKNTEISQLSKMHKVLFDLLRAELFQIPYVVIELSPDLTNYQMSEILAHGNSLAISHNHTVVFSLTSLSDKNIRYINNLVILYSKFTLYSGIPDFIEQFFSNTTLPMIENENVISFIERISSNTVHSLLKLSDDNLSKFTVSSAINPQIKTIPFDTCSYPYLRLLTKLGNNLIIKKKVHLIVSHLLINLTMVLVMLYLRYISSTSEIFWVGKKNGTKFIRIPIDGFIAASGNSDLLQSKVNSTSELFKVKEGKMMEKSSYIFNLLFENSQEFYLSQYFYQLLFNIFLFRYTFANVNLDYLFPMKCAFDPSYCQKIFSFKMFTITYFLIRIITITLFDYPVMVALISLFFSDLQLRFYIFFLIFHLLVTISLDLMKFSIAKLFKFDSTTYTYVTQMVNLFLIGICCNYYQLLSSKAIEKTSYSISSVTSYLFFKIFSSNKNNILLVIYLTLLMIILLQVILLKPKKI